MSKNEQTKVLIEKEAEFEAPFNSIGKIKMNVKINLNIKDVLLFIDKANNNEINMIKKKIIP